MITYFSGATPEEQLNLWYNGNEHEVVLAKYLEESYKQFHDEGYKEGYDDAF